jgi:hypothetical protein
MKKLIIIFIGLGTCSGYSYESQTYVSAPGVDSKFAYKVLGPIYQNIVQWANAPRGIQVTPADLKKLLGPQINDQEKAANLKLAKDLHEAQVFICPQGPKQISTEPPALVVEYGIKGFCKNRDQILKNVGIGLFATALKMPVSKVKEMVDLEVLKTVQNFAKKARSYDPAISDADVFQASRNVWTAACLQKLLGTPIELSSSIYGYSMLYPYTDNVFDDPSLDGDGKKRFMKKFGMMLLEVPVDDLNASEKKVSDMVRLMYQQFPPKQYSMIHQSVLAIYYAQIASLEQRSPKVSGSDVLFISGFKGSTSVLADAFFAKPNLSDEEFNMAVGFGFLLQLIDDLQDMDADNKIDSQTVFTVPYKSKELVAGEVLKMLDLGHKLMLGYLAKNPKHSALAESIYAFLRLLTFEAIAQQQDHFEGDFLDVIEGRMPAPLSEFTNVRVEQQIYDLIQSTDLK